MTGNSLKESVQAILDYKFHDGATFQSKAAEFPWESFGLMNDLKYDYNIKSESELSQEELKRARLESRKIFNGAIDAIKLKDYARSAHMPYPDQSLRKLHWIAQRLAAYYQEYADASWRIATGEQEGGDGRFGRIVSYHHEARSQDLAEGDASTAQDYREIARLIEASVGLATGMQLTKIDLSAKDRSAREEGGIGL